MAADNITDKQRRFCEEYLIDLNATQAAIRAGYSEATAAEQGSRLLINVNIQNYIQELKQNRSERLNITADMVLQELGKIGFSNVQDYLEGDLSVKDLTAIDRRKADAVSSIKKTVTEFEGGSRETVEFKLHDKLKALEMIGRHIGFFEKDNEQGKAAPIFKTEVKIIPAPVPLAFNEKDIEE